MATYTVKLTQAKAEEMKEGFPDGRIPVSSLRMDYDPKGELFYYHVDVSALSEKQADFLVKLGRQRIGSYDDNLDYEIRDEDILAQACIKQKDTCCPDCGTEGKHDCQAATTVYDEQMDFNPVEEDYEEDIEEGEIDLFSGIPFINENIGSMMEAQLLKYGEEGQCRQCGKFFDKLKGVPIEERYCSPECREQWERLMEIRIMQGKHDLRTRGYD
jgi:hypothetical protein